MSETPNIKEQGVTPEQLMKMTVDQHRMAIEQNRKLDKIILSLETIIDQLDRIGSSGGGL
jgi:hypothetical protein|tara:strand:+ start:450 stop:629 length:180 start_codon:yes stop_codon:yes gene_type:complete